MLYSQSLFLLYFMYGNLYLLILYSQFISLTSLFPLVNHKFVFCVCFCIEIHLHYFLHSIPCCSLKLWHCQSFQFFFLLSFFFWVKIRETEMLQTLHFLQSFYSGFLPFMLLIELFWWSIKLSFLICLQICQVSNSRKVQNQWWVEHFQIIFNKCFLYWSHLQILQLKVNLNNWEFTKKS